MFYYHIMNFDLAIVMYGDASFKHFDKNLYHCVFDLYHRMFEIHITRV